MSLPDGHTRNIHAAAPWARRGWQVWCAALLATVVFGGSGTTALTVAASVLMLVSLLMLSAALLIATRPEDGRSRLLSLRHATRALLPAALALLVFPITDNHDLVAMAVWGLVPIGFWIHCRQFAHAGSVLARRIRQMIVGWIILNGLTVAAVGPFVVNRLDTAVTATIVSLAVLTWMLGVTALWYSGSRVMRAFGDWGLARHVNLQEFVETGAFRIGEAWLAHAEKRGWDFAADSDGINITGTLPGNRRLAVRIWSARVPTSMEITVDATALRGLRIGPHGTLPDRQPTGDPLLDSCLDVSADDPALLRLLDGQHEALMEIFHAHPTARLEGGALTLRKPEASVLVADPFLTQAAALLQATEDRLPVRLRQRQHLAAPTRDPAG